MLKAERAYRAELAKVRIADILGRADRNDEDGRIDRALRLPRTQGAAPGRLLTTHHSRTKGKNHGTPSQHRQSAPEAYQAVSALDRYMVKESGLAPGIIHLIKIRASQINGCAYCVDMHVKEARRDGFSEQWMHMIRSGVNRLSSRTRSGRCSAGRKR